MNIPVVPFGRPRAERADAARNRRILLETARAMLAEQGPEKVTMDALAERAGLGKGTVFRRFGSRAGIFHALLDDTEQQFQQRVLSGPPPLGPGAEPKQRLIAFGRARITYLLTHQALARAAVGRNRLVSVGAPGMNQPHIRALLSQTGLPQRHLSGLTVQLTSALEGPLLLYVSLDKTTAPHHPTTESFLADSWQFLIERLLPD